MGTPYGLAAIAAIMAGGLAAGALLWGAATRRRAATDALSGIVCGAFVGPVAC